MIRKNALAVATVTLALGIGGFSLCGCAQQLSADNTNAPAENTSNSGSTENKSGGTAIGTYTETGNMENTTDGYVYTNDISTGKVTESGNTQQWSWQITEASVETTYDLILDKSSKTLTANCKIGDATQTFSSTLTDEQINKFTSVMEKAKESKDTDTVTQVSLIGLDLARGDEVLFKNDGTDEKQWNNVSSFDTNGDGTVTYAESAMNELSQY